MSVDLSDPASFLCKSMFGIDGSIQSPHCDQTKFADIQHVIVSLRLRLGNVFDKSVSLEESSEVFRQGF